MIAAGDYSGGFDVRDVSGDPEGRITIRGADPVGRPSSKREIVGRPWTADCNYLTLADFIVDGCTINGLNFDDGGSIPTPMHDLVLRERHGQTHRSWRVTTTGSR